MAGGKSERLEVGVAGTRLRPRVRLAAKHGGLEVRNQSEWVNRSIHKNRKLDG